MMGRQSKQPRLWSYNVNLDRRVRADHPLRQVEKLVDFGFVYREVKGRYGAKGNVSVDPVIILKMLLLLFLYDVSSERELMRTIPERLDWLWFLGYGLDEEVPDHSVLSKARRRWGTELFERLFERVLCLCVEAGLVQGEKLHLDASLVRANASKNSIKELPAPVVRKMRKAMERLDEPEPAQTQAPAEGTNATNVSTTDPDATLVRHAGGKAVPSYKNHRGIDDKAGVITAVATTTGAVDDAHQLPEMLAQHRERLGHFPQTAVGDSKFGTMENYTECQKLGVRTHMADLAATQKNNPRRQSIFPPERFRYDRRRDVFICPADKELYRRKFYTNRGHYEYIARAGVCAACRLRPQCTRAKLGRTLKRHPDQKLLDRARKQAASRAAKLDRKRRQHLQERNFADAANNHGFKRARWRGLWRQRIQDLLIATLQNLRILIRNNSAAMAQSLTRLLNRFAALLALMDSSCRRVRAFRALHSF
jgi:transposase